MADDNQADSPRGPFRLLELLGSSAKPCRVYRAVDADEKPWALKVIAESAPAFVAARLERELEVAARLSHPNVVPVVGRGEQDGLRFIVRELVEGTDLGAWLRRGGFTLPNLVSIAVQVLDALEAAHALGIYHRDVKPGNIFVDRQLNARLMDFGLARIEGLPDPVISSTPPVPETFWDDPMAASWAEPPASGEAPVFGTPAYMAPEQWRDPASAGAACDIYSLGCTLFEMLTGRRPFEGEALASLMYQHAQAPRPAPGAIRPGIPESMSRLVQSLFASEPTSRPPSARAARLALEEALGEMTAESPLDAPGLEATVTPVSGAVPVRAASPHAADSEPATTHDRSPEPQGLGKRIGDYALLEKVWADYSSDLYRAEDTHLEAEVTIEVFRAGFSDAQVRERFLRRAKAGARLDHPNIQKVFALLEAQGDPPTLYCVLEPFRGETLADHLDRTGPLPFAEVLDLTAQALAALAAVHREGFVHRDIKPRNLLLKEVLGGSHPGRMVKLTGFHLVHIKGEDKPLTREGVVMGTPSYMSPEQARGETSDARTDLYGLGASLYHMLCGRRPYDGSSMEVVTRIATGKPPDPREFRPDIPDTLHTFLHRLMAPRREDRFPGADEALAALEEVHAALRQPGSRRTTTPASTTDSVPSTRSFPEDEAFSAETVMLYYPAPVALAYRRFTRTSEPRARLERLVFTVEAVLRYLVTLGVSDLFQCLTAEKDELALPAHPAFDFVRKPKPMQLGMWAETLRETSRELAKQPGRVIRELAEVCEPGGMVDGRIIPRLIGLRNDLAHPDGGIAATGEECDTLCQGTRAVLEELLEQVRFIRHYPLGFVRKGIALEQRAGAAHPYYLHSCMGAAVQNTAAAYHFQSPTPLREDVPFVAAPDGRRLLYLWPLLLQRLSPMSERHTLYVFEDIPDRKWPFLTLGRWVGIDAREEWRPSLNTQPAASHSWMLGPLRELQTLSEVTPELQLPAKLQPTRSGTLTGMTLEGGIKLLGPVGRGGFGTIYAGRTPDGEQLAIKVLEASAVSDRQLRRFQNEFDKLRKLAAPGIIRCRDFSALFLDGRVFPWYSMEFAIGGDLANRVDERRQAGGVGLPWIDPVMRVQVIDEFRQIVAAVAHLHEHHIIHRDLKPSNVLIMEDGTLRLSDFGLAKNLEASEQTLAAGPVSSAGAVLGTRQYMAPEQAQGRDPEEPADVYALGVLLAELATGDRPQANLSATSGSTLQSWSRLSRLPAPLRQFLLRLTAVAPEDRPRNAGAVREEFERLLTSLVA